MSFKESARGGDGLLRAMSLFGMTAWPLVAGVGDRIFSSANHWRTSAYFAFSSRRGSGSTIQH